MKRSLLTLGVACLALSSFGATKILYQQNFETATSVEETGWSFPIDESKGQGISIGSDSEGKYLEIKQGQQNGRSGSVKWGQEIFLDKNGDCVLGKDGVYSMKLDFMYSAFSNNQYNSAITVFTNANGVANQPYVDGWTAPVYRQNYLFNVEQNNVDKVAASYAFYPKTEFVPAHPDPADESKTIGDAVALDMSDAKTLETGMWYTVELTVNTVDRNVDYIVTDVVGEEVVSGTYQVPETDFLSGEPISMFAEGIWVMMARYQTILNLDNIVISYETEGDNANPPTIALTRVGQTADEVLDLNIRAYSITFLDGETLHVTGTDGKTIEVEYADCDGNYTYETTTSGVLKAWTTSGEAISEEVTENVDCTPIVLPAAEAIISGVEAGYGKTYTLSVSNADVPLRPVIYVSYEFKAADGTVTTGEDLVSGNTISVDAAGTLTLTTAAFGYEGATTKVENDIEYSVKKVYDFARMSHDEITAALTGGQWYVLNSNSTSGFNSWTGRTDGLYYNVAGTETVNEETGDITYEHYKPFGFASEESTTQVLNYCEVNREGIAETTEGEYFEGLTIFPDKGKLAEGNLPNVVMLEHIGLINNQTNNNNNYVYIHNLEATDFVLVNSMHNYGRGDNSTKPVCSTDEEYYAQLAGGTNDILAPSEITEEVKDETGEVVKDENGATVTKGTGVWQAVYELYRVDTAIVKMTVFAQVGGGQSVEGINAVVGDGYYYSIDGIRVAQPTRPGLYIHNGKKIIVK